MRDFKSDWNRWSSAERIGALVLIACAISLPIFLNAAPF
jgi:hypothetical protein